MKPNRLPALTTTVFTVQGALVNGRSVDLLAFANRRDAEQYAAQFGLPIGFDRVEIVEHVLIGAAA
jgi:hypothetical protein